MTAMKLPTGTYFEQMAGYQIWVYALDQDNNLWAFAHEGDNQSIHGDLDEEDEEGIRKVTWFSEQGLKVVEL